MQAVWLVRGRELAGRFRFWTAIVGYDPRDRSVKQSIYLVYVFIFFSIWGLAVLALLADLGAGLLTLVSQTTPVEASIITITLVLFLEFFIQGFSSAKQSPYIFSEADSELICQTPVDRRQVALTWFLGDWIPGGILVAALAVVFRFAIIQLAEGGQIIWQNIPSYLFSGLQTASIVLPIHLAFIAFVYVLGSIRLKQDQDIHWLRWVVILTAIGLVFLLVISKGSLAVSLLPVHFSLEASFGGQPWFMGLVIALTMALIGLSVLYWVSAKLNLSRAAQESRYRWALKQASRLGNARLTQTLHTRQRLGVSHRASRIPGRAGVMSLVWKNLVASVRAMNMGYALSWVVIFGLSMGLFLVGDWGSRLWIFVFLCLLIGQRCTSALRSDMAVWSVTRQLPFSSTELLAAELCTPVILAILLPLAALLFSCWTGTVRFSALFILEPVLVLLIVFSSAYDIIKYSHSNELLMGQVDDPGFLGLILGVVSSTGLISLASWLINRLAIPGIDWIVTALVFTIGCVILAFMWKLLKDTFMRIA